MTLSNHYPNRLADYFVVCGLDFTSGLEPDHLRGDVQCPPLERSYKGTVLEHFPISVPWNTFDSNAVCMMCLPQGLQFRTQKQSLEPKFHSFIITREDGSRYYGCSLVFYEEMRNKKMCSAVQTLQAMYITELSSTANIASKQLNNSRSLPRHFKLSTQQHSLNYYDSTKDTLFVTKSVAIIMQLPYVTAACKFLTALHRYAMTKPKVPDQLSVESYIYNFLYDVPLPQPGRSVEFELVNTQETVIIQRPITIEELPLLDFSLRELFTILSVDVMIQLFTCILLENQILICSSDFQKLMLVAECLTSLLFPFTWQHVYVPILPASLHHFLDAPVPFIMGLHSQEPQLKTAIEGDLCYINIDIGEIETPEELPNFPKRSEFCNELSSLLDKYGVCRSFDTSLHSNDVMSSSAILTGGFGDQVRRKHSWCNEIDNNESSALQRVVDIARRSGVEIEGVNGVSKANICTSESEYKLNNAVREMFLNRFVNIFHSYEHFVILPTETDKNEWFRNRESMQNFDKATFLSDQPTQHLPFLSQFLETQMFASLIDSKILATFNEIDPNLRVFDKRINNSRKRNNRDDPSGRGEKRESCEAAIRASQLLIEKRLSSVDLRVPAAKEVLPTPSDHFKLLRTPRNFPTLDVTVLNKEPAKRSRCHHSSGQWCQHRKHKNDSSPHNSLPRDITRTSYNNKLNKNSSSSLAQSPAGIAQANWNFVEKLLKDCKCKTNRMVVEKMGAEGVMLGKEQIGNVEENTLIASLCDLLERVWSHAIQEKQGKSALWSHLLRFQKQEECNDNSKTIDQNYFTPDLSSLALELDIPAKSGDVSPATTPDSRSLDRRSMDRRHEVPSLKPLPVSVTFDIRNVQAMSEIKSQIGYARAWVRLSLEKKLLSRHLQTLLSDTNLLRQQYKRNAFLRCDEEKEQFLFHLLSLNAVDYFCFTNTYLTTKLPYRVVIFPSRKSSSSTTTANAWVAISGTNCETAQVPIPKGTSDFLFHHKNLGMLTSLRIGHDNTGLSPNWMVENVLVRCEVTGHTFRFPCGRYLGKSVDDGSTERLLVGELMKRAQPESQDSGVSINTPPVENRSPMMTRRDTRVSVAEIQLMIGDSVNNIVKYFHRNTGARQRENCAGLTPLLCGEMGLVHTLEQAFLLGFKASRLFGRNLYLWDYFLRVKEQFDSLLYEGQTGRQGVREGGSLDRRMYNNNNGRLSLGNVGNENEMTRRAHGRIESDGRWRERIDGHIPRSIGVRTLSCDRRLANQRLSLPRERGESGERRHSLPGSNSQVITSYCELISKIENSNRTFGKDGKFQRFICLAVRDHLLHRILTPLASSRPTTEMYEDNSFLRNSNLRSFLVEILQSLDDYEFFLESSITSGIDKT